MIVSSVPTTQTVSTTQGFDSNLDRFKLDDGWNYTQVTATASPVAGTDTGYAQIAGFICQYQGASARTMYISDGVTSIWGTSGNPVTLASGTVVTFPKPIKCSGGIGVTISAGGDAVVLIIWR